VITGRRAALAAVLDAVDGVQGRTQRPGTPRVGDGWATWRGGERAGGDNFLQSWQVIIVLPGDLSGDAGLAWLDQHLGDVFEALEHSEAGGYVESVAPISLAVGDNGTMPAVQIMIRTE